MLKRISLLTVALVGVSTFSAEAFAALNLKKVNIVDGNQIELIFDGKVESSQIKTEFVRDNIQLSLSNTSVYPAKVSMVSGSDLTKVFAYQYSPALVRARFTVKGDASNYANRLQVKISGKSVTVKIAAGKSDQVATTASSALKTVAAAPAAEAPSVDTDKEKKKLLERVAAEEKTADTANDKAEKAPEKASGGLFGNSEKGEKGERHLAGGKSREKELGTNKPLPSPFRSIGVMLFVLGVFGLFVMFLKRLKSDGKSARSAKGAKGLGGFLSKLSGQGAAKEMIEVVATHHLAPKRSIVVVRVQNRMLVLGMTNDSVNLITEFKAGEDGDAEENIEIGDFAASLKKFENEPAPKPMAMKTNGSKANLGDIAAAALGLAKPKPASAPRANAAANAYQATQSGDASAAANSGPAFSPAIAAALNEPSVKPSIRAQIKDRVQGMKQL